MTARIENHSQYPTQEVTSIVRRVLRRYDTPDGGTLADCSWLTVKVRMHRGTYAYRGRFYTDDDLIVCRLGYPEVYPCMSGRSLRGGPPRIEVPTWQAALVGIVAHEAGHAWQLANRERRPSKPKFSEVECEWFRHRAIRDWLAGHL